MADGVVVADESERFLVFNPAAERMFGGGATETTSAEWSERYGLYLPDTVTPFPADELPWRRAVRGESARGVEIYVRHPGKDAGIWVSVNAQPLRDDQGRTRGGVAVCREITERKTNEERLRLQNVRLREVAERRAPARHEALKQAEVQLVQAEKLTALARWSPGSRTRSTTPWRSSTTTSPSSSRDVASLRELLKIYEEADPVLAAHAPDLLARHPRPRRALRPGVHPGEHRSASPTARAKDSVAFSRSSRTSAPSPGSTTATSRPSTSTSGSPPRSTSSTARR